MSRVCRLVPLSNRVAVTAGVESCACVSCHARGWRVCTAERSAGAASARRAGTYSELLILCARFQRKREETLYYSRSTADRTSSVESRVVRRRAVETPRVVHLARALSPLYRVPPAFLTTRDHTEHSTQIV